MKKILLTLLAATPLMFSCSSDDNGPEKGEGRIVIENANVSTQVPNIPTRATSTTDLSTYYILLSGSIDRKYNYPDNDILTVPVGHHTVTLASHESMPAPAFDVQYYAGSAEADVALDQETAVTITATQQNAGVKFEYDPAFATAGITVVPTVTGTDGSLTYAGAEKDSKGYFAPGRLTVTLKDANGNNLSVNDGTSGTIDVVAKNDYTVKLQYSSDLTTGTIKLSVTVISTVDNQEITFTVSEPEEVPPFTPETVYDYEKSYAVTSEYCKGESAWNAGYEKALAWNETLTAQYVNDQYSFLSGNNFGDQNLKTLYTFENVQPHVLFMDFTQTMYKVGNEEVRMKLCVSYTRQGNKYYSPFTNDYWAFTWDEDTETVVFEGRPWTNAQITDGQTFIAGLVYDFTQEDEDDQLLGPYTDFYGKIYMKMNNTTNGGAINPSAANASYEIIATKEEAKDWIYVANPELYFNTDKTMKSKIK